jgi:hypothetical protein
MLEGQRRLALELAGPVWPTPPMALGSIMSRGASHVESGLAPLGGRADADILADLHAARSDWLTIQAQHGFTLALAFALSGRVAELETEWLRLADQHLELRARIVTARAAEEALKAELARYGVRTTRMPVHDELPEVGGDRPKKSRGMYSRLFDGCDSCTVDIDLDDALMSRIDAYCRREGLSEEWGDAAPLSVFIQGLFATAADREADKLDTNDATAIEAARHDARASAMGLEGRYATLRYRLFELRSDVRILQWRITALQIEERGMRARLEKFADDAVALRGRLDDAIRAGITPIQPEERPAQVGWLRRLLGGRRR